ncbi:MAG: sensor histidine kinase [Thiobacillus sp.]
MKRRSLAFSLTVILGGVWLVLVLAVGAAIWHTTLRLVQEAQSEKARALATQLATISLDATLLRDYGVIERYVADLSGAVAYVEIRRTDGQVLGRSGQRVAGVELVRVPMRAAGEEIGEVLAQYDPRPARRAGWQLAALMALALATFTALSFWALRRLLLGRLVAPVTALIEQADPERPAQTMPTNAPAEVADLASSINGLRARIGHHLAEAEEAAHVRNEALRRLCSEQRLAAVGQLAGEVAHELNTPLSNILGYAQSALPAAHDPALRESLETIEAQARRAAQIVRDMLSAARAPAPALQKVDLKAVCAAFVRLVTPLARKQGVGLTLEASGPVPVRADASRVEQILFNLVSNAMQAGARTIRLTLLNGSAPAVAVSDDGPGLPESVRMRLFEPFVTTKPAGQGTGLGLAISQRLAREMHAQLVLEPSAQGTCFRLVFSPLAEGSP